MCLFTNDITAQCNHVQCNLIKTIQMQNPQIFPHIINSINNNSQNQQQYYIPSVDQSNSSQSLEMSSVNNQNQEMIQQFHHSKKFHIKEEFKQNPVNHSLKQYINLHQISQNQSQQQNHQINPIDSNLLANYRISILEKQVNIIQNAMKNLIDNLKQKNIITQQQYNIQYSFLKQVQDLQKLLPPSQQKHNHKK